MSTPVKLVIIAVVIVVLFVVAVVLGVGDGGTDINGPVDSLRGRDTAGSLRADDLAGSSCGVDVSQELVRVGPSCELVIAAGRGFRPSQLARSLELVGSTGTTQVSTELRGRRITTTIEPGDDIDLRFGRAASVVTLTCASALVSCELKVGSP